MISFSSDAASDEGREHWPRAGQPEGVEPAVGQVGDAWGEPEAEQMRQGEGVIADAAAVGVMGGNAQICLVIEQAVNHMAASPEGGIATVWYGAWRAERCV
jgi:hypothetical protein